ncbi:RNA polymerase sigma factor [Sphingosinicella sp. LHD-64]|uniref:RNA polymerase sigma factor n=1 Tax=Sphingosinicella sp. LHD-64 TaxID=3072139 RepID=UPI00280DD08B|nr:RNA polymerase sigma factor [Sphingosinicella sp. LHD-64]MDQ8757546.1 RNA polymerase sigma factor [Sphingosinicella sp. LHD-64]
MVKSTRALLRTSLAEHYTQLRDRLTARLGSKDLAGEALHETWLKLHDGADLAPVDDPHAYLYRAALNTASHLAASSRRVLGTGEIDEIMNIADDAPDPERIAIGRSELAHVWKVLGELTPRQRHIFIECFTGTASHAELAEHHGVGVRMIQIDLRDAILHCVRRTRRKNPFVRGASRVSVR